MRLSIFAGVLAAGATFSVALALPSVEAPITISGSTTVKPIVDVAAKAFKAIHPDIKVIVGSGGSSKGVALVADGKVRIGMASRSLKEQELADYPDLQAFQIATDGIAIVLHDDNPVKSLSSDDVRRIFLGQATNWSEFGGNDAPIEPIAHQRHHGTYQFFAKFMGLEGQTEGKGPRQTIGFRVKESEDAFGPAIPAMDGNSPVLARLSTNPGGISWASIGFAANMIAKKKHLKLANLDGVEPTAEHVANGSYPMQRPLLMVTQGAPDDTEQAFLDYMLSDAGQALVAAQSFLPVDPAGN